MRKHKSKLKTDENCIICNSPYAEEHHCLHGTANRKKADQYGLTVYLCHTCHMRIHDGDREKDLHLIRLAQLYFENHIGTRADFIKEFGKNYL